MRSRQDGGGGPKGPDESMIIHKQTATIWALWQTNKSTEDGRFNYMKMGPLRVGPRIKKEQRQF